ncbi:MAG: glycosyltransferase [Desulfobacterales bacterium]|nr:glycosyltransferase [Desulfobacterales bacterium]
MQTTSLRIAMISIHSSPLGPLGTRDTGGMSVYIRETARELGRMGHRVDIFTRRTAKVGNPVIALAENVRLVHLSTGNGINAPKEALHSHIADFYRALEAFRNRHFLDYDLIHSHYWLSGLLGEMARESWQRPHVITFHTLGAVKNSTGVGKPEPLRRIATEKNLAATCERVLSTTAKDKVQLVRLYDAVSDKIGVVPCGVDLNLFRPLDTAEARHRLGFAPDHPMVLFVGRFDSVKGIDRLVTAMTYLRRVDSLRLVLVGGDGLASPVTRRLQQQTRDLGLQDTVTFAGRIVQDRLPPYYSAADVLVVPSLYESFGLVGLEALACGTPVVATPVGAMESILQQGRTGQVVTEAAPRLLAEAIETFLPDKARKALSADDIRASVLQFSWSKVAAALAAEYAGVCAIGAIS